jgi:hypothetical protein
MKKIIFLPVLFLTIIVKSHAATTFEVDGLNYEVITTSPATVKVIAKLPIYSGNIVIPEMVTYSSVTYVVTKIALNAFKNCTDLTAVILPATLLEIESSAFYNCPNIKSFEIPSSVTKIGNEIVGKCTGLTSISIPNSVTTIGSSVF